ncbi:methionine--tRNA ligase subunit beta [archaeon]|jgi:methionyl-tRNA synthetase|nr:methionine--tRNA ligase subunit beta [archaeon]
MDNVKFEDWMKLDLRVAEILEADEVEGADKLVKLKVDMGTESRVLMAGLKKHYSKDDLIGKRVIVFANLEPRVIRGVESKGMVLAAVNDDGSEVKLLSPSGAVDLGSRVS